MEISISGVNSPIPSLYPYVQHADLESWADIEKLNTLDARINGMTQEEQRLFSGALELECTGDLDFAVHVANSLDRYEICSINFIRLRVAHSISLERIASTNL